MVSGLVTSPRTCPVMTRDLEAVCWGHFIQSFLAKALKTGFIILHFSLSLSLLKQGLTYVSLASLQLDM